MTLPTIEDFPHTKDAIEFYYKDFVTKERALPSFSSLLEYGVSRDMIRRHFGGIGKLHDFMRDNHKDYISSFISSVEEVFAKEKNASEFVKKRLVITTAVADSPVHKGFLDALDNYCWTNDAEVIIMPCESVTNSFENKTATFDPVFSDPKYLFVQDDTRVNENLSLCSIQVSAKQIKPITGLSRVGQREGSYIFASPKQFLEYVPSGNQRGKNYSIMTPGACTLPKYYSEVFVSKRLSYIAEHDHTIGAIIVEIIDEKTFHFRQIQADEDGSFIDFGVKYSPNGDVLDVPVNVIMGDLHGINHNEENVNALIKELAEIEIKRLFVHDIFDAYSISHHVTTIAEKQTRAMNGEDDLGTELSETFSLMLKLQDELEPEELFVVKSNHDEFLDRYLAEGRYVEDAKNHYLSLLIAPALFESKDVLKTAFEKMGNNIPLNWNFLSREDSYRIGGVECAAHGDLGVNGARPSLNSLEKVYGDCVVGHSHSPAIQRGVFQVGTLSLLDMGYNRGPSTWMPTSCLLYENGQRQLINIVNGSCRI